MLSLIILSKLSQNGPKRGNEPCHNHHHHHHHQSKSFVKLVIQPVILGLQKLNNTDRATTDACRKLNPFPQDKILDHTKLKVFADDKLNVTKMVISFFDRVENIVGKGEIACSSNFSFSHNVFIRLLSQMRQKVSSCGNGSQSNDQIIWTKCEYANTFSVLICDNYNNKVTAEYMITYFKTESVFHCTEIFDYIKR